jgi:glycerol-3-phosphate O-acyltransferase
MPTFKLTASVTVSAYTTVEADTLEDAIAVAAERHVVIGGINSGESYDESWIIEDADGEAENIASAD